MQAAAAVPEKRKIGSVAHHSTGAASASAPAASRFGGSAGGNAMRRTNGPKAKRKRLVIRNYAVKPKVPENFAANGWKLLDAAVDAIYGKTPVPHTREKLYGIVEDLCMHGQAATLLARLREKFAVHVNKLVRDMSQQTARVDTLLEFVDKSWAAYCSSLQYIQSIFLYLETNGALQQQLAASESAAAAASPGGGGGASARQSLWALSAQLFRDKLEEKAFTGQKLVEAALLALQRDRAGQIVDRSHVRNAVDLYWNLGLYHLRLEPAVLRATREYYSAEAEANVATLGVAAYLRLVAGRIRGEGTRATECLRPATRRAVLGVLRVEMVAAHSGTLMALGFESMMETSSFDDLGLMYRLFVDASPSTGGTGGTGGTGAGGGSGAGGNGARSPGRADGAGGGGSEGDTADLVAELLSAYGSYIVKKGLQIVAECRGKELQFVDRMLGFKAGVDRACAVAFRDDRAFVDLREHSMARIMNHRASKPAEALARYFDRLLKDQTRLGSTTRRDSAVDNAMVLFRYVNNKDVFEACFSRDLSRRLLLNTSTSTELELAIVQRLKAECGNMYTTKMEGMFQDIQRAAGLNTQFAAWVGNTGGAGGGAGRPPAFSVRVLTMGTWPSYPKAPPSLHLPTTLAALQEQFRRFYVRKFQSRALEFLPSQGQVVLKATFGLDGSKRRHHELHVSEYQALVLLAFNVGDAQPPPSATTPTPTAEPARPKGFTFAELLRSTGIPRTELQGTLLSLCSSKVKILKRKAAAGGDGGRGGSGSGKGSHGTPLGDAERVVVNDGMKSKLVRIVVNSYQGKLTKQDVEATNQRVQRERMFQVDAAIVRLLKARRTMPHQALMLELQKHLKFDAQPQLLKKRIESLLEREYLERDATRRNVYHYTA